jgi:hypothetical protein
MLIEHIRGALTLLIRRSRGSLTALIEHAPGRSKHRSNNNPSGPILTFIAVDPGYAVDRVYGSTPDQPRSPD